MRLYDGPGSNLARLHAIHAQRAAPRANMTGQQAVKFNRELAAAMRQVRRGPTPAASDDPGPVRWDPPPDLRRALDSSLSIDERQKAYREAVGTLHLHPGLGWHSHPGGHTGHEHGRR